MTHRRIPSRIIKVRTRHRTTFIRGVFEYRPSLLVIGLEYHYHRTGKLRICEVRLCIPMFSIGVMVTTCERL